MVRLTATALFLGLVMPLAALGDVVLEAPGLSDDALDSLRAASLSVQLDSDGTTAAQDIVAAARADYSRLLAVLYERGYFGPVIRITVDGAEAAQLSPFDPPLRVNRVRIAINPGPVFHLGRAEIAPLAPGTDLPEGFQTGQRATTPVLRQTAQGGVDGWRNVGHAAARVDRQQITARQREAELDALIILDPGPLLRFGDLLPEGQERMHPDRIAEIAGLPTGEVFSPDAVDTAMERLRRTGVFRSVSGREATPETDGTLDIAVLLDEAPLRRFGFGGELDSIDGLSFSGYWMHRNITGAGDRLRFDAEISGIGGTTGGADATVSAGYGRPATFGPDTVLNLGAEISRLDEPLHRENVVRVEAGLERILTDRLTASAGVGLSYSDIDDSFGARQVTLATLPLGLGWDDRDDTMNPTHGTFSALTLTPFTEVTGGNAGYRATLDGRGYLGFGDSGVVLAGRVQLGTLDGGAIAALPPDMLFYSGGGGTVRGQGYQSLGALQGGLESGGRGFVGLSAELRAPIGDSFGLVGFYDQGYISAGPLGDASGTWHSGGGIGLRYDTGIGPIRLDLATPLSGPSAGQNLQIYIGIGQSF